MDSKIGTRLKAARIKKGLSQAELAQRIGVSQAAIGQWERGQYLPKGKNINLLNQALTPELLLTETWSGDAALGNDEQLGQKLAQRPPENATSPTSEPPSEDLEDPDEPVRRGYRGRRFKEEVAALLLVNDSSVKTNSILDGPNNRRWVIDITTSKEVILFVNPGAYTQPFPYGHIDQSIHSTLWRLTLLRHFLGDELSYVAVVFSPPSNEIVSYDKDGRSDYSVIYKPFGYDIFELVEDADAVGLHVIIASSPEEATTRLQETRT